MRTPIKYYGGKTKMLPHILPLIPSHRIYVEGFAGGAAVYFAKKPSKVEVLNDINGNVTNFYRAMKLHFDELLQEIECTLHCEKTHSTACFIYNNPNGFSCVHRAWAFWVAAVMSYGGEVAGSFQWVKNKTDNWHPAVAIKNRREQFQYYRNRLETTAIRDLKAEVLIPKIDSRDVFFYLDPPYVGARQGHYEGYTQEDFDSLLMSLENISGKFLMSSYKNKSLYDFAKRLGWHQQAINQRVGVAGGSQRKIEMLTWNYSIPQRKSILEQSTLFNHIK